MASGSEKYRQALSSAVDSHRRTHISKLRAVAAERRSSLMQLHAARGQEVAKKISKTVSKLNNKIKLLIPNYNSYSNVEATLPATLSFKDVSSEDCQAQCQKALDARWAKRRKSDCEESHGIDIVETASTSTTGISDKFVDETKKEPHHLRCPDGPDSWCFRKKAVAAGETPGMLMKFHVPFNPSMKECHP
ncbi:hypothetical protein C0Q70_12385 [Pomacea canaliculata]|uniref:Uncharacterized protein n=1 Tax=Pomacea canaliculata TaxID=400727 RepID=A0A2T7P1F7_POMCA|nr:hypothetical protein C0Q70_12385 [Pomacea canaliculata]